MTQTQQLLARTLQLVGIILLLATPLLFVTQVVGAQPQPNACLIDTNGFAQCNFTCIGANPPNPPDGGCETLDCQNPAFGLACSQCACSYSPVTKKCGCVVR